jgi:hypothetical protein
MSSIIALLVCVTLSCSPIADAFRGLHKTSSLRPHSPQQLSQKRPAQFQHSVLSSPQALRLSPLNLITIPELFNVATFAPQPFWLLMIGLPNWKVTKDIMGPLWTVAAVSAVHFAIGDH